LADGGADCLHGEGGTFVQQMVKLGKGLLDRFKYLGSKKSLAPAARMSWRMALPLWPPRLSMMTISLGRKVGMRTVST
jgi:hypothetical protein